jgi:hypothetical protein
MPMSWWCRWRSPAIIPPSEGPWPAWIPRRDGTRYFGVVAKPAHAISSDRSLASAGLSRGRGSTRSPAGQMDATLPDQLVWRRGCPRSGNTSGRAEDRGRRRIGSLDPGGNSARRPRPGDAPRDRSDARRLDPRQVAVSRHATCRVPMATAAGPAAVAWTWQTIERLLLHSSWARASRSSVRSGRPGPARPARPRR